MTLPGAPCIYYGDEVGLAGREDPDCRRAYPWDPARQDRDLRDFVVGLTAMRHAHPVLRRGRFRLLATDGFAVAYGMFDVEGSAGASPADEHGPSARAAWAAGVRAVGVDRPGGPSMVVVVNAGDTPARLELDLPGSAGSRVEQVSWSGRGWGTTFAPRSLQNVSLEVQVAAREGVALEVVPAL
jgi:glycosidase